MSWENSKRGGRTETKVKKGRMTLLEIGRRRKDGVCAVTGKKKGRMGKMDRVQRVIQKCREGEEIICLKGVVGPEGYMDK